MIAGTGIDIIEVERINKISRNPRFLMRVFTLAEREYFERHNNNPQVVSGNFAAKEAVAKALGTGIGSIGWQEIEVLREQGGRPYVNLYGRALCHFAQMSGMRIWISISHVRRLAIAQAIIECKEGLGDVRGYSSPDESN